MAAANCETAGAVPSNSLLHRLSIEMDWLGIEFLTAVTRDGTVA